MSLSQFTAGRPCEDVFTAALSHGARKTVPFNRSLHVRRKGPRVPTDAELSDNVATDR